MWFYNLFLNIFWTFLNILNSSLQYNPNISPPTFKYDSKKKSVLEKH